MSNLTDRVKDLRVRKKKKKDLDPEDGSFGGHDDSDSSEHSSQEDRTGREHYETVGKSSIRKPEETPLDAKYGGVAVRRAALVEDDEHNALLGHDEEFEDEDPFAKPSISENESDIDLDNALEDSATAAFEDDEIDSDEAFGEGDAERFKDFKFRGSKSSAVKEGNAASDSDGSDETGSDNEELMSESGSEDGFSDNVGTSHSDQSGSDGYNEAEDESDEEMSSAKHEESSARPSTRREELKALLSGETAAIASTLSQAATSDAQKGDAVKRQNEIFDRLLDARIKLQKGLVAANDEVMVPSTDADDEAGLALHKAQEAALRLYSTIESLRQTVQDTSLTDSEPKSKKRKRVEPRTLQTPTASIWDSLVAIESQSLAERKVVLDKWSNKIRASDPNQVAASTRQKFLSQEDAAHQSRLSAVLDTYLLSERDRLMLAATSEQGASQGGKDADDDRAVIAAYEDGTFYQSLLRDLINNRSAASNASSNVAIPVVPMKLHPSGNKARQKIVDTRASKGRKVRYTVHEKLQNFMAAEGDSGRDTSQWTEAAKREFFGSLMGQSRALDEDEDIDMEISARGIDGLEGDQKEVEALRLFRS